MNLSRLCLLGYSSQIAARFCAQVLRVTGSGVFVDVNCEVLITRCDQSSWQKSFYAGPRIPVAHGH